jgi:hypothetical protein
MTVTAAATQLNRAYVQSKVIEANLHHVADVLSRGNADLSEDLQSFTQRFGEFVLRLSDASDTAAGEEARR